MYAAALISDDGGHVSSAQPLARHPRAYEAAALAFSQEAAECGEGKRPASLSLDMGSVTDRLHTSGGVVKNDFEYSGSQLDYVLRTMGKEPLDLFPPNRIAAICSNCGDVISRFRGYRQNKVG